MITCSISSRIKIKGSSEEVWKNITNVRIDQFSHPFIFRILDIPKPLKAEIISDGEGGKRIAYFDNDKKFVQEILEWKPFNKYSFAFNPEKGFRVGYLFDLSDGVFKIPSGSYELTENECIILRLQTAYSFNTYLFVFLYIPFTVVLKLFQTYLLKSIKKNSESGIN